MTGSSRRRHARRDVLLKYPFADNESTVSEVLRCQARVLQPSTFNRPSRTTKAKPSIVHTTIRTNCHSKPNRKVNHSSAWKQAPVDVVETTQKPSNRRSRFIPTHQRKTRQPSTVNRTSVHHNSKPPTVNQTSVHHNSKPPTVNQTSVHHKSSGASKQQQQHVNASATSRSILEIVDDLCEDAIVLAFLPPESQDIEAPSSVHIRLSTAKRLGHLEGSPFRDMWRNRDTFADKDDGSERSEQQEELELLLREMDMLYHGEAGDSSESDSWNLATF